MDDKTKIRLLKGLLAASVVNQLVWINASVQFRKNMKKALKVAVIQKKAVDSFIHECEERQQIDLLAKVMDDIAFDVITFDL